MTKNYILMFLLCFITPLLLVSSANASGNLKSKIQKELDVNPFLKKEGVKLRVTSEESGYVTIEMYSGNRRVREKIDQGLDVLTSQAEREWLWTGASESEKKTINILRRSLAYVKNFDEVKDVLLIAAINTDQDRGEDIFNDAKELWKTKKYDQVVTLLQEAAELGYVRAQSQLGEMYFLGKGVERDLGKSISWSLKAIEGGSIKSCARVGEIYILQDNYSKAIEYLKKGAEKDDLQSISTLAWIYATCKHKKFLNGKKAVDLALTAVKMKPMAMHFVLLAAAYARDDQYDKAVEAQQKGINMLKGKGDITKLDNQLTLYKKKVPYTDE